MTSAPPSSEIGYVASPGANAPSWAFFSGTIDHGQYEDINELRWPNNIKIYHRMRTDSQIDALTSSVVMPLLRLNWKIAPNGARDEVVSDISTQLNLPIQGDGDNFVQRGRKRFNHAEHLRMALLAPTAYGHMFFEPVGDIDPETLAWRLNKLAPRMPQTISKIDVARDGGLISITQFGWGSPSIPVTQLVAYPWEKEGANWTGRSMLRPLYKHWLIKDRLLRIDAMKNERFGLGIPYGEAAPGGDPASMQQIAASTRAVEHGGTGLPNGAKVGIAGVSGSLPDTLGSIRYQDEAMARSFLAMFMQLGQTDTGSRALGESFVDFFVDALAGFANWYANITSRHVIEDIVDWNYGEDEQAPLLVWEEREEHPLSVSDLALLAFHGALVIDADLQNWIRKRFNMPEYTGEPPLPTRPGVPIQDPTAGGSTSTATTASRRSPAIQAAFDKALAKFDPAQPRDSAGKWAVPTQATPSPLLNAPLKPGREAKVSFLGSRDIKAASPAPAVGHRNPNEQEIQAKMDFERIQQEWEQATTSIVDAWGPIRDQQIDALVTATEQAAAAGDATALANLEAPVLGVDIILQHMQAMAELAIAAANSEAKDQGLSSTNVEVSTLGLAERANAIAALMARDLAGSAARNAVLRYGTQGITPVDVAAGVRSHLESLTTGYMDDNLGGAMTQAQNAGRRAVISAGANSATRIYASELLDERTCEFCAAEDGTEFTGLSDAETAYPAGGYVDCAGGARCRGTLVAVYNESE